MAQVEVSQCDICQKSYKTSTIARHISRMHGKNRQWFKCEICDKELCSPSALKKHILTQHENDPVQKFTCEVCFKEYRTKFDLNKHRKSHVEKEESRLCTICNIKYKTRTSFRLHRAFHEKKKQVCDTCGKEFTLPQA